MDPSLIAILAPCLGQFTAFFLFYAATPGLIRDRKAGRLTTDPTPFPVALLSTLAWLVYATVIQDPWILVANLLGLGATSFNTITVLTLSADQQQRLRLERATMVALLGSAVIIVLGTNPMVLYDASTRLAFISTVCLIIVLAMFASPCVAAVRALCTGDASEVSLPLAIAQVINCCLWGTYGFVTMDWLLIGPNGFGFSLAVLNVIAKLRWLLQRKASMEPAVIGQAVVESGAAVVDAMVETGAAVVEAVVESGAAMVEAVVPMTLPKTPAEGEYLLQALSTWARKGGYVGVDAHATPKGDESISSMCNESDGSRLRVVLVPKSVQDAHDCIALMLADGRYLCVDAQALQGRGSRVNPSPFRVAALRRDAPGDEGSFVPVYGDGASYLKQIQDPIKREDHRTREEAVCFWNPKYQVFVRANEEGALDCSPVFSMDASGRPVIPAGWEWERFTLRPVEGDALEKPNELADCCTSV